MNSLQFYKMLCEILTSFQEQGLKVLYTDDKGILKTAYIKLN